MRVGLTQACYPKLDAEWSYVPPLGLGYLASYVKKHLPEVEIIIERDPAVFAEHRPDFIGITFGTSNASYAAGMARRLKDELGCPILSGGPHVSTLHGVLDPAFDVAVVGEGEETFLELVRLWQHTGRFDPRDLAKIQGLAYHNPDGPGVVETPRRSLIEDLNAVPFPDRGLLHGKWSKEKGGPASLITSRGCPYHCAFCSSIHQWGRKYRYPSNEYVVDEIEHIIVNYEPTHILIFDDLYNVRKQRVIEISRMVRERGLHQGNHFRAFVRANLLDDEVMEAMRAMNIVVLNIGFESGSSKVLATLNKKACTLEDNLRAIALARKHGVRYSSCFILGTPGETREDILDTFDFILSNADVLENVQFAYLSVFPSTDVWQWASKVGVNEQNLTGAVLDPEDAEDEDRFLETHWPYLNEEKMPREELLTYVRIGRRVERLIQEYAASRPMTAELGYAPSPVIEGEPEYIAENVPIASILKAKAKRRLKHLMRNPTPKL